MNQQIIDQAPEGAEDWTHYVEDRFYYRYDLHKNYMFYDDRWIVTGDSQSCARSRSDIEQLARLECQNKALKQVNAELERENEALKAEREQLAIEQKIAGAKAYIYWCRNSSTSLGFDDFCEQLRTNAGGAK